MEAKFETINGLQSLVIHAVNENAKVLLQEFFQKEIPGYDHALTYNQIPIIKGLQFSFAFSPTMTSRNLMKEALSRSRELPRDLYLIERGGVVFEMNPHSHSYTITETGNGEVLEKGVLKNIYEYRKLLPRLNGYAGGEY